LAGKAAAPSASAAKNIRAIAELERAALHERTRLDRFTDAVTESAGSPAFIIVHAAWFTIWIGVNVARPSFDPYPYNLLTLAVSLEAIFLTSFVMMTQNRMTRQADRRAHLDLQVNLLAEQELTAILQMVTALCERTGVSARDAHVADMVKDTDIHTIAEALDRELETPGRTDSL
jgi:uncharacterized membrane protein